MKPVFVDYAYNGEEPLTDHSRWRLREEVGGVGDHVWEYLPEAAAKGKPQSNMNKYWLGIPLNLASLQKAKTPMEAAKNGYKFYKNLQSMDGHWPGEYGGPHFLLPGLIIGTYVTELDFAYEQKAEIIRYLFNRANPDGGWGIHIEGDSTVFGTALNYVVLRLLGVDRDHPKMVKARHTLLNFGGATGIPSWGKFWLSILNVYEWEGNNPIPPELWLLPDWVPIHPHRWWIHTRNVYIPMSFLYGHRFKAREDPLILSLRKELYTQKYEDIDWPAQRNNVAAVDIYSPHTKILDCLNLVLGAYELCSLPPLRRAALNCTYELIVMEDDNTDCQCLGPVNKMMNQISRWYMEGSESPAVKKHHDRNLDFMWMGSDGMRMCGTNGSQLWDIAFIAQALAETGLALEEENRESMMRALEWIDRNQMTDNPKHFATAYRQATKGAWPFSTKTQGYTVSDCAAEGLKATLYLQDLLPEEKRPITPQRLFDSVDILLDMQNPSGGYASYELIRAPKLLELINPAEVFGNIMTEFEYPECTTSVITGLAIFKKRYPTYRNQEIDTVTAKAIKYLHHMQYSHGGWFGSWGICFTYATMFALESLSLVGETYSTSPAARKACEFLVSKQREDGGWGESYKSCEVHEWVEHPVQTQVVQTAWATMALMYAEYPHRGPIERAVNLVMDRQLPDGSWVQEAIEGVFNKNVAISYPNFKFSFTIWMLGKAHKYLPKLKS